MMNDTNVDWDVLDDPQVEGVLMNVARKITAKYGPTANITVMDAYQDAVLKLVTTPAAVGYAYAGEFGLLHRTVEFDLHDLYRPVAKRGSRTLSYEDLMENAV